MRKPDFCLCENKGADQLCNNCTADQRLGFRYMDSTIPLLLKSEIPSFKPSSLTAKAGLCRTWSETPKTGFLSLRLYCSRVCFSNIFWSYFGNNMSCVMKKPVSSDSHRWTEKKSQEKKSRKKSHGKKVTGNKVTGKKSQL